MSEFLRLIAGIVNELHDLLVIATGAFGLELSDKQLHFWVIGLIGLAVFVGTDLVFRRLAQWNISAISLIYTTTVLVVFVFAIEIQQKITQRGTMSFSDVTAGLWGFVWLFAGYVVLRVLLILLARPWQALRERIVGPVAE